MRTRPDPVPPTPAEIEEVVRLMEYLPPGKGKLRGEATCRVIVEVVA